MKKTLNFGEQIYQAQIENLVNMRIMVLAIDVIIPVTLALMPRLVVFAIVLVQLVAILIIQAVLTSERLATEALN